MTKSFYSFILAATLLLISCKKDREPDAVNTNGTLTVSFTANFSGQAFAINSLYNSAFNYRIKTETLKFLVHHIIAKNNSGSTCEIKDAFLVNFASSANSFTATLPQGNYDGIKFGLGVDGTLNHSDPSVLPASHAFSINQANDMFWSWSTGYIFMKWEGKADTTGTGSGATNQNFFFHTGADTLYRELTFYTSPFSITAGQTSQLYIDVDVSKFLVGTADTIDLKVDNSTHTADNLPLASRFVMLYKDAFTVHQ